LIPGKVTYLGLTSDTLSFNSLSTLLIRAGAVVFLKGDDPITLRDYWDPDDLPKPIVIKEDLALHHTLSAAVSYLRNKRVDAHTDSLTLVRAWKNQGGKSLNLTSVLTTISDLSLRHNIGLTLCHVPSKENLADTPSRVLSEADCMLARSPWHHLERHWGPHTIDLMSLDSNAQLMAKPFVTSDEKEDGKVLRHFSP
jgi:hypothetical protein